MRWLTFNIICIIRIYHICTEMELILVTCQFICSSTQTLNNSCIYLLTLIFVGFHEGVANAITLSIFNPMHLKRVGLLNNSTDAYETNINFLMLMALKKVAYAPFAYLIDQVLFLNYLFY